MPHIVTVVGRLAMDLVSRTSMLAQCIRFAGIGLVGRRKSHCIDLRRRARNAMKWLRWRPKRISETTSAYQHFSILRTDLGRLRHCDTSWIVLHTVLPFWLHHPKST